ncbi:hypothetical protein CGRA01v4_06525 [Colletotrichum graminicola]|nr:hypothetical protein CGRA01v4_06525 [Colletotrichum graminicola]
MLQITVDRWIRECFLYPLARLQPLESATRALPSPSDVAVVSVSSTPY